MAKRKTSSRRRRTQRYEEPSFRIPVPVIVRERPLDSAGVMLAGAVIAAIIVNATLLQDARSAKQGSPSVAAAPAPRSAAAVTTQTPAATDPSMLVREVQAELSRRGLYDGPADGVFGPKTEAAIFDFEIGAGLKPTGRPNPQLLAAMRSGATPAVAPSPRVAAVQRVLDQQGFGPVKSDGVAGEATRAAIRRFEASRGLPQKGEITPALLRELSKATGATFD